MVKRFSREEAAAAQVLSRMDDKGESIDAAIEAVTGAPAKGAFAQAIIRNLRGE